MPQGWRPRSDSNPARPSGRAGHPTLSVPADVESAQADHGARGRLWVPLAPAAADRCGQRPAGLRVQLRWPAGPSTSETLDGWGRTPPRTTQLEDSGRRQHDRDQSEYDDVGFLPTQIMVDEVCSGVESDGTAAKCPVRRVDPGCPRRRGKRGSACRLRSRTGCTRSRRSLPFTGYQCRGTTRPTRNRLRAR